MSRPYHDRNVCRPMHSRIISRMRYRNSISRNLSLATLRPKTLRTYLSSPKLPSMHPPVSPLRRRPIHSLQGNASIALFNVVYGPRRTLSTHGNGNHYSCHMANSMQVVASLWAVRSTFPTSHDLQVFLSLDTKCVYIESSNSPTTLPTMKRLEIKILAQYCTSAMQPAARAPVSSGKATAFLRYLGWRCRALNT
jgi:hypothetical protein